ncbi:MAG: penicillin-binding transpeptidase domain-containing protein, partial [Chloroflexi bacterium]|nr:penicillin-binding transpeptidase domain-containing protein [Chloroflexota bacterium]
LLRGKPGLEQVEVDVNGRKVRVVDGKPPEAGANLVLSIDLDLQRQFAKLLQQGMGQSAYTAGGIMDVHTGELLALVSLPSYNNNVFSQPGDGDAVTKLLQDERRPMLNYAFGGRYPPGSIFKTVTGTAALQEGVATTSTRIFSPGVIYVQGWPFYDWAALGSLDFYRGVAMSSDVYFYYLSGGYGNFVGLGADRLAKYARDYGLEELTGIDLPGEVRGNVPDPAWKEKEIGEEWRQGDSYNFGIGQGFLSVTPLQMLREICAVANGGDILQPRVLHEVIDGAGQTIMTPEPKILRRVGVSPENLAIMREAMRQTVATGTANAAQVPGVSVAGKTGTAEFFKLQNTREHLSHGWFLGFAPADKPKIAIVIFQQLGNGALTATPVGGKMLQYYFERERAAGRYP